MIREVKPSELPELADLAQRSYAHTFAHTMSEAQLKSELEFRSEKYFRDAIRHHVVLVYVEDGRLLGYSEIRDVNIPEITPAPGDQLLDRLYVDQHAQGKNIGRQLLEASLAHPRLAQAKRVYLQVWSENQRALNLYQSHGFKICGTTRLGVGQYQKTDEYIMVRQAPGAKSEDN